jgi:hypothetical protein
MTNKTQNEKKPGEKPEGKFHFNPGNMAGKTVEPGKDVAVEDSTNDQRERNLPNP